MINLKIRKMDRKILVISIILFFTFSCEKDRLEITPSHHDLGPAAGSVTFTIKSNTDWEVTDDASWLAVSPESGNGDGTITATCLQNELTTSRVATITVTDGKAGPQNVTVTQDAADGLDVSITWTQKTDMPTARGFIPPAASVVDDKIYIIGGTSGPDVFDNVEVYDPSTDSWESKSPLPDTRWGHSSDTVGGKIYVMGGCLTIAGDATNTIEVYDPSLDEWESGGNMPTGRIGFGSCVVNGKIYVMGGRDAEPGGEYLNSVHVYDPATDTWESLSPMPAAIGYFTASAYGDYIYAIGGVEIGAMGTGEDLVFKYKISSDVWSQTTSLKQARWGIASCLADTMIVCVGGYISATDQGQRTVELIFTGGDNVVRVTDMINSRAACSVCMVNNKIYILGGMRNSPPQYQGTTAVEEGVININ